jgi:hypothetical protein
MFNQFFFQDILIGALFTLLYFIMRYFTNKKGCNNDKNKTKQDSRFKDV